MYGYLIKFRHYNIRFRTDEPNYDDASIIKHDWSNTSYRNGEELLPDDAHPPKGKRIVLVFCPWELGTNCPVAGTLKDSWEGGDHYSH